MPLNSEHDSNVPIAAHRVQIGTTDTARRDLDDGAVGKVLIDVTA